MFVLCVSVGTNNRADAQDRQSPGQNTTFHIFNETPCGLAAAAGATVGLGKISLHPSSVDAAGRTRQLEDEADGRRAADCDRALALLRKQGACG